MVCRNIRVGFREIVSIANSNQRGISSTAVSHSVIRFVGVVNSVKTMQTLEVSTCLLAASKRDFSTRGFKLVIGSHPHEYLGFGINAPGR